MAKHRDRTGLAIGILAIGGFVAYEWWKGQHTTTTTTTTSITDTAGGGTNMPVTAVIPTTVNTQTATTLAAAGPVDLTGKPLPAGISQEVYNKVYSWAKSDGRPPVIAMANAMVPSEYNGMYDIITTQWQTGAHATTAQANFWDNLRTKYDPHHTQW